MQDDQTDPYEGQYPPTSTGPTDWVPDGQGGWMPPPSQAPPGKHWDPHMANWVDNAPTPPPPAGGGTPPPPGPNLTDPFQGTFTPPAPVNLGGPSGIPYIPPTPTFNPPGFTPPPAFKGPNQADVLADPGYQFRLGQGEQALQQGAAAKGTLNGGATQKAILGYGQDYASNEFNNVYNRQLTDYNTNYQTQYLDPYKFAYQSALDQFAPQMIGYETQAAAGQHQNDSNYNNLWQQYLQEINNFRDQRDSTFSKRYTVANT